MQKIIQRVRSLIEQYQGIRDPAHSRISFPCGLMRDGTPYEIILYLKPMPTLALLDRVQEDLEYLRKPH